MWYPCPQPVSLQSRTGSLKTGARVAAAEPPPISIQDYSYGPNPVCLAIGELVFFNFTVVFSGAVPDNFDYVIDIYDRDNTIVKTLTSNLPTSGQSQVAVKVNWDGKNTGGQLVPPGGYGPYFTIIPHSTLALEDDSYSTQLCSGIQAVPPPPCDCDAPLDTDLCP